MIASRVRQKKYYDRVPENKIQNSMPLGYHNYSIPFYSDDAMRVKEEERMFEDQELNKPLVFDTHDPQMTEKICAFARERRADLGVAQLTISKITNIRQGHISDIEHFNRPNVSFNHLARLLIELNCRIIIEPLH